MNFLAIFAFTIFLNIAYGLKCVTTSEDFQSTTNKDCYNSKYCFTLTAKVKTDAITANENLHGCGSSITVNPNTTFLTCDQYGKTGTQIYDNGGVHSELYCCDTDLCNSLSTTSTTTDSSTPNSSNSFIGISISSFFITVIFVDLKLQIM